MKNKGYYGWIHSLNQAGLQAQQNGLRMLNEAKAGKITDPATRARLMGQMPKPMPVNSEVPSANNNVASGDGEDLTHTSAKTIAKAGGDISVFDKLITMKQAEEAARLALLKGPVNLQPDGDANGVASDGADGVMADPARSPIMYDPPLSRLPSYALAAQARAEHAKETYRERNRAGRVAARQANAESEYEADEEANQEGIAGIIDRMLRGKN
jgi:hypothetical protein